MSPMKRSFIKLSAISFQPSAFVEIAIGSARPRRSASLGSEMRSSPPASVALARAGSQPRLQSTERRRAEGDRSAVQLREIAHDCEAEAGARRRLIRADAALQNRFAQVCRDPRTVIVYADEHAVAIDRRMERDARLRP